MKIHDANQMLYVWKCISTKCLSDKLGDCIQYAEERMLPAFWEDDKTLVEYLADGDKFNLVGYKWETIRYSDDDTIQDSPYHTLKVYGHYLPYILKFIQIGKSLR